MAHIMIRHKVGNFEVWKEAFENFAATRKASGEKSFTVMRHEENANNLYLLFEWDTAANARAFLDSSELKETMQAAGVTEAPEIQFLNKAIDGTL